MEEVDDAADTEVEDAEEAAVAEEIVEVPDDEPEEAAAIAPAELDAPPASELQMEQVGQNDNTIYNIQLRLTVFFLSKLSEGPKQVKIAQTNTVSCAKLRKGPI